MSSLEMCGQVMALVDAGAVCTLQNLRIASG